MIYLDDLLHLGGRLSGIPKAHTFTDFSYDSRLTQPGELFLALHTPRGDGYDYIPAALAAGATGVLCSWPPRSSEHATVVLVDNPETFVQQWATRRMQVVNPVTIAVTGSVGKTSTKQAIATLLSGIAPTFASRQSFNTLLGLPVALARLQNEHRFAVLEFGSDRFGEIAQLSTLFPPHIGVITSVGNAHLKSFGSLAGVAQEKGALVEALPCAGWAILNGDNPHVVAMAKQTAAHVITFGQGPQCDLRASDVSLSLTETTFRIYWQGNDALAQPPASVEARIPLIGEPAVAVALAATGVALACGMPLEQAASLLAQVKRVNGRLNPLPMSNGAMLLDDTFNAVLPSMLAALRTVSMLPAKRRIVLFGDLADQSANPQADYREMGKLAGSIADVLICKGDWGMTAIHAAREVKPSLQANIVHTATAALQALPDDVGTGDLVLIKGSMEARMERIAAGLLDASVDAEKVLVRQEAGWCAVHIGAPSRPTWLRIDLDAVAHNVRRLCEIAGVPVMAVIKADGYGHGATRVARAALASGALALAVATLSEARALREVDITAPILVLGYTPPWQAHEAVKLGVTCAVFDSDTTRAFSDAAVALRCQAVVHVKVDTGMGRLGMPPEQACAFLQDVSHLPGLTVEGLYSHFATADSADETFARLQLRQFEDVLADITAAGLRPPVVHMANSAATLRFPQARFDMVRPGIGCYGLNPSHETPLPADFKPVLSFHTRLAQVKSLPAGVPLSYGGTFVTRRDSLIGTIPVGYADGFRRVPPWHEVLVRGQRAPVVGRVCMDYALVDVTDVEDVKQGDAVVLIGEQGDDCITADEVAHWLGTINYEVVSAILPRVPREVEE